MTLNTDLLEKHDVTGLEGFDEQHGVLVVDVVVGVTVDYKILFVLELLYLTAQVSVVVAFKIVLFGR